MIPELIGLVTRHEGKKFLKLKLAIDETLVRPPPAPISLYIHIPFCRTLCPFCCFNRYLFKEDQARAYFKSLRAELDLYVQRGFKFADFYFGGGTPTVLMDELGDLISYLKQTFGVKRISLETTPRELNEANVRLLQDYGVNRLSVGVQSFDQAVLKSMGRLFITPEETRQRLAMVQGKFDTVNVDFVFNFPGQSVDQFRRDVAMFKEMGIDQATFYPLMASPHKKDALERRFNRVDLSRERSFYEVILKEVYGAGYTASTAWCFSRGSRMIDEYIIDTDDYVGIGSGSVSIVGGNFYVNSFSLERYGAMVGEGKLPVVGWRGLSPAEHRRYYLLTKLFGLEVDEAKFKQRFGGKMARELPAELMFLKTAGLVKGNGRLTVTPKGLYAVSVMMREFFAALNGLRERFIEKQV